jgi:hypothetical protein
MNHAGRGAPITRTKTRAGHPSCAGLGYPLPLRATSLPSVSSWQIARRYAKGGGRDARSVGDPSTRSATSRAIHEVGISVDAKGSETSTSSTAVPTAPLLDRVFDANQSTVTLIDALIVVCLQGLHHEVLDHLSLIRPGNYRYRPMLSNGSTTEPSRLGVDDGPIAFGACMGWFTTDRRRTARHDHRWN